MSNTSTVSIDINKINDLTQQYIGQGSAINTLATSATSSLQECQKNQSQIQSQINDLQAQADTQVQQYQQATTYNNNYLNQLTNQFADLQQQYKNKIIQIQQDQQELDRIKQQVIQQSAQVQSTIQQKQQLITQLNEQIKNKQCSQYKTVCYLLLLVFLIISIGSVVYDYQKKPKKQELDQMIPKPNEMV